MASRGVNKVIIVGNLGQDPEVRFFPNGGSVCNVTIATSEHWKDKQSGEKKEKTEWHKVSFTGKLAEIAGEYLKKGSKVYIEGSLRTRKWQNQQGQDQYTTEIRANEMQMLDSRTGGVGGGQQPNYNQNNTGGGFQQQAPQQPAAQQGGYQQAPAAPQQNAPQQGGGYQQSAPQQGGYQQPAQQGGYNQQAPQQAPKVNPQEPTIDFDDDIPFQETFNVKVLN